MASKPQHQATEGRYELLRRRTLTRLELASKRRQRILQAEREGVEQGQVEQLEYATGLVDAQRDAAQRLLFELRRTSPRADRVERLDSECERLEAEGYEAAAAAGEAA